jgi:Mitotic-spindle organizing gamma-tubulin ring associated
LANFEEMSSRKTETLKFTSSVPISSKNLLSSEEAELFELAQLAGVAMDPKVFK